jgi:predicted ribosomally synthesized peptide with nif11-like leader
MNIDDMNLSPELREKAKACKTPDEMLALAKAEGYKLSEEELTDVSGCGRWSCYDIDDSDYKPWKD